MDLGLRARLSRVSKRLHRRALDLSKPAELNEDMALLMSAYAIHLEALLAIANDLHTLKTRQ